MCSVYFHIHIIVVYYSSFQIIYVEDDVHMVCGGIGVMDLEGASMAHFSQMSPALMKKMTVLGQVTLMFLIYLKKERKHFSPYKTKNEILDCVANIFWVILYSK